MICTQQRWLLAISAPIVLCSTAHDIDSPSPLFSLLENSIRSSNGCNMARLSSLGSPQSIGEITQKLQFIGIWISFLSAYGGFILLCGLLLALYWWFTGHSIFTRGLTYMHSPKPFPFLDLPTEIRFMIYEKLLCAEDRRINICNYNIDRRTRIYPSILCVNSQIYSEAAPVLYDRNIINIHYSYDSLWPIQPRDLFWYQDGMDIRARTGRLRTYSLERQKNYPLARPATYRPVEISPHRFRRMRQIEITMKFAGVYCGASLCEDSPEHRRRIISLLKSLICLPGYDQTTRRTLTLIHQPHHIKTPPSPHSNEMRELSDHMNQKCVLLQCLSRIRTVKVINILEDTNQLLPRTSCSPSEVVESISSIRDARAHYFLTPFGDEKGKRQLEEKTARKVVGRVTDLAN